MAAGHIEGEEQGERARGRALVAHHYAHGVSLKVHGRYPYDDYRILGTHGRSYAHIQSACLHIGVARVVSAACRGQARRVHRGANHESMRGFDRDMAGMCTCAGAPMMSSAVLRAATCWNARAPILTSRQARSKYLGPGMAFWTGFFDSGEAGRKRGSPWLR